MFVVRIPPTLYYWNGYEETELIYVTNKSVGLKKNKISVVFLVQIPQTLYRWKGYHETVSIYVTNETILLKMNVNEFCDCIEQTLK